MGHDARACISLRFGPACCSCTRSLEMGSDDRFWALYLDLRVCGGLQKADEGLLSVRLSQRLLGNA